MDSTKKSVKDQVHKHQNAIHAGTKLHDFELILHKLDDLKYLNKILDQSYIREILKECIDHLIKVINDKYEDSLEKFRAAFSVID